LAQLDAQLQQMAAQGMSWMAVGELQHQSDWSESQWVAFLRMWKQYAGQLFMRDESTNPEEEKNLYNAYLIHWTYYACLPERPEGAPEELTTEATSNRVDAMLESFEDRLGDPLQQCAVCGKCAVGRKMSRCGQCKQVFYCGQPCQKEDWRQGHKRTCVPIATLNPKEVDKLVRKRYSKLRRDGKNVKVAMQKARTEYGLDKIDESSDAGKAVAAMFGMPL
jgi:hypothetical protein